jgi:predicted nucleic-acid-binding Zn-ribbon protein
MKAPEKCRVNDKELTCLFCGETLFYRHEVKLNKSVMVFLDIEWLGKTGSAFICANCGYKHEFYP